MPEKAVKNLYIVFWWSNQEPKGYIIEDDEVLAASVAASRNGLMLHIHGDILDGVDYFKRDEAGHPLPIKIMNYDYPGRHMPWGMAQA